MANQEHLDMLKQGVDAWNEWRKKYQNKQPNLSRADLSSSNFTGANLSRVKFVQTNLSGANLSKSSLRDAILWGANLSGANLSGANLLGAVFDDCTNFSGANLNDADFRDTKLMYVDLSNTMLRGAKLSRVDFKVADLSGADLSGANLAEADLSMATLSNANLSNAILVGADLIESDLSNAHLVEAYLVGASFSNANLSNAILVGADLSLANLVRTNLKEANLTNCRVYGISAWDVQLEGTQQINLVVTPPNQPTITVDNLKVAQFIYLLLKNEEIRNVIDTITSKVVLILGRFTDERKKILDALRNELRKRNYSPVLFDFEKPANRDITETVSTLAHMARFVIADITDAKSIPQELSHIIPFLPSVPIVPLLQVAEREYGMYEHFVSYPWVQPIYYYRDLDELLHSIQEHVIEPAEKKVRELAVEKARRLEEP